MLFRSGAVGAEGVLLHRILRAGRPVWMHFRAKSPLADREELLVPPGCEATINVGGLVVRLLSGTQATLAVDDDGTPRIELVFGRLVARSLDADARLAIKAGRLNGVVTAGLTSPVAAMVELDRRAGDDPLTTRPRITAEIIATTSAITWRQLPTASADAADATPAVLDGIAEEGMLEGGRAIVWDGSRPDRVTVADRGSPGWVGSAVRGDPNERRAAAALAVAVSADRPLIDVLHDMTAGGRVENRILAAATLALLGDYDDLVALLAADMPGDRLEARQWQALEAATVPLALARGANAAARLQQAFANRGPRGKADLLFKMAAGFGDDDLAAGADRLIVESLEDPDLVVRRYAAKNLFEIVQPSAADRIRYRPDGLPEMRREGATWWRVQLEKGLVRRAASR